MPIPKNFAIITRPRIEVEKVEKKKCEIDVLLNFPGAWKAINEKWLESPQRLKYGQIEFVSEIEDYRHFKAYITYARKGIAAKEYTEEEAEFDIWQHKNGFSLVVNAPKELAELAATFLSVYVYKDPFALRIRRMNMEDFLALIRYTHSIGGKVITIHLRYVKTEDMGEISVLKISGKDIEKANVNRLLSAAKKVTRIGFQIPFLGGEEYKFWIGHWGGGTIYTPPLSEVHHIWNLVNFFENAIKE